jgi:hypothetical protein
LPPEPERRRYISGEMNYWSVIRACRMAPPSVAGRTVRVLLDHFVRTISGFMTCMGMFGSGLRIVFLNEITKAQSGCGNGSVNGRCYRPTTQSGVGPGTASVRWLHILMIAESSKGRFDQRIWASGWQENPDRVVYFPCAIEYRTRHILKNRNSGRSRTGRKN